MEKEIGTLSMTTPERLPEGMFTIFSLQTPDGEHLERIEMKDLRQSATYPQDVEDLALFTASDRADFFGVELRLTEKQAKRLEQLRNIPMLEPAPYQERRDHPAA